MDIQCPKCAAIMNKSRGVLHTKYICPDCGHVERKFVGNKYPHSIRLYPYQKQLADKRGGVQFVVDSVLTEDEDDE